MLWLNYTLRIWGLTKFLWRLKTDPAVPHLVSSSFFSIIYILIIYEMKTFNSTLVQRKLRRHRLRPGRCPLSELSRQQEAQLCDGDATQTLSLDSANHRHQTKEKYVSFSFGTWDTKSLESQMICRSYGQGSQIYFKTEALLGCIKCRRKGIPRGMVKSPVCITVRCASKKPGKL